MGFKSREVVEICGGNGSENNGAYFVHNHGFRGVFFDGDAKNTELCKSHFNIRGIPATSSGLQSTSRAEVGGLSHGYVYTDTDTDTDTAVCNTCNCVLFFSFELHTK